MSWHSWDETATWQKLAEVCQQSRVGALEDEAWAAAVCKLLLPFRQAAAWYDKFTQGSQYAALSDIQQGHVQEALRILIDTVSGFHLLLATRSLAEMDVAQARLAIALQAGNAFQKRMATQANRDHPLETLAGGQR
ncbi:MAG TPA: hypothetical protein VGO93_02345 [Candidatus Xenobia bacterium]|jgi:hypothetical protein